VSKEITKYWEETCIDFGKYVQQRHRYMEPKELWIEYQNKMAKDVEEILDEADRFEKDMEKAYKKALKVIDSCKTAAHVKCAYNYSYNFWKLYANEAGCTKLYKKLQSKCKTRGRIING